MEADHGENTQVIEQLNKLNTGNLKRQLSRTQLITEILFNGEGVLTESGAVRSETVNILDVHRKINSSYVNMKQKTKSTGVRLTSQSKKKYS